jgi:hypothetical protein
MLIHIFEIFFFYIQIQYDLLLLLLLLRDLAVCMKTKHFIFLFFYVLTKTEYFNTGFVSLQYKIQTNIDQNAVKYLQKITTF